MDVSFPAKLGVLITLIVAVVTACTIIALADTRPDPRPVLLLTGDSQTGEGANPLLSGWVAMLRWRYVGADVITRALPGYNTKWFLKYVAPTIAREIQKSVYPTPSLITIWFGSNDAALANGTASKRHVPIADYKNNLIAIARSFQTAAPTASLLLITPLHVIDSARAKISAEQNGTIDRTNAMATLYARACVEVGAALQVPVLDLHSYFNAMPEIMRSAFLLADGLHLSALGNRQVNALLQSKLALEFFALKGFLDVPYFPAADQYLRDDPWRIEGDSQD
ncbi:unnamed protein product [Hyaloperonospora brassicae]|uniref:SGNH hydrolase-type esterase domain-containing protein n=1 Tax=Hyaloperonospora brassicae TaxID=162125 RepID=A0AAV0UDE9_HYABA|nr:unnamed protein product [Hyaloperonospora brassicae]